MILSSSRVHPSTVCWFIFLSILLTTESARSLKVWVVREPSHLPCLGWRLAHIGYNTERSNLMILSCSRAQPSTMCWLTLGSLLLQYRTLAVYVFALFEGPAFYRVFADTCFHIAYNTERSQFMCLSCTRAQPSTVYWSHFDVYCSQRRALEVDDYELFEGPAIYRVLVDTWFYIATIQSARSLCSFVVRRSSLLPCLCLHLGPYCLQHRDE